MRQLIFIAHNLRSTHNVGSLLRTADGLGVAQVWLTGYTPYPLSTEDNRLPHIAQKLHRQIHKTALGAETTVTWHHRESVLDVIADLKRQALPIYALEQTEAACSLPDFSPPDKLVLIVGREVEGLETEVLAACNGSLEIPMYGSKESYNVVQAAAMALYHCRFR